MVERAKRFQKPPASDDRSGHIFAAILQGFLLPFVFILTKIGEATVQVLFFFYRLLDSSFRLLVSVKRRLSNIHIRLPSFHLRFPHLSFPKKSNKNHDFTLSEDEMTLLTDTPVPPQSRHRRVREQRLTNHNPKIIKHVPFLSKLRYFSSGVMFGAILLTPLVAWIWISELPSPYEIAARDTAMSTKLYDRHGTFLFQFYGSENRSVVPLSELPTHLVDATIAIEDKNFYHHQGFDLVAIIRAARETIVNKNIQGGSTITQQLIKSTLLTPDVELERKIKEVILAFWAERIYTKDEILEMYFNQVPYGGTAWGVEAAAQTYFAKSAKDLTLAESALIAGLPSGPSIYSPFGTNPQLAKERQKQVLSAMLSLGYISKDQEQQALNETLAYASPIINIKAPHFVMYVKDYLVRRYGIRAVEKGGLRVFTTLDLAMQEQAQEIVRSEVEKLKPLQVSNAASLITNPQSGEILAMVGSRDYFDRDAEGNVNVTTAHRQPGSSIKVITYAAALEKGMTASTVFDDSPITYNVAGSPAYSPVNYDGRFHGRVTMRTALANSYNVPAVKALAQIGVPAMIDLGKRMGITTWDDEDRFGLSLTLGGGEVKMTDLATVYGVLATGGIRNDVTPVLKVTDAENNVLEELRAPAPGNERRVLPEGIAFIISDMLADNNARTPAFGPSSIINIPNQRVSVKTGTTDQKRDNWTIGYTKDLLVAVWVGNNDNSPMHPSLTSGITGAAPIWNRLVTTALTDRPSDSIAQTVPPTDIVAVPVCQFNGLLPCGGCPTRTEYFVEGTQPKLACNPNLTTPAPAIGGADNQQPPRTN